VCTVCERGDGGERAALEALKIGHNLATIRMAPIESARDFPGTET
jgi:hypothetical protein